MLSTHSLYSSMNPRASPREFKRRGERDYSVSFARKWCTVASCHRAKEQNGSKVVHDAHDLVEPFSRGRAHGAHVENSATLLPVHGLFATLRKAEVVVARTQVVVHPRLGESQAHVVKDASLVEARQAHIPDPPRREVEEVPKEPHHPQQDDGD